MHLQDLAAYIFLLAGVVFSIITKKLTATGAVAGSLTGLLVYKGAGYTGLMMLTLFFLAGSLATGWHSNKKKTLGISEENNGQRTAGQVIANGGVAAFLGGLSWFVPVYNNLIPLMIAGSLAAALADTLSSELGSIYGSRFYDIISFKEARPGPDGVISLEGTLIGIGGAILMAFIYGLGFGFNLSTSAIIAAGFTGNLFDSILGATLERRNLTGNNVVNFINTTIGALVCLLCYLFSN